MIPNVYELIITTIRNRSSVYTDHGFCVNAEVVAKEINEKIQNKAKSCVGKDGYNYFFREYNVVNMLILALAKKETQWGIHEPDHTIHTKEKSQGKNRNYSPGKDDFYTLPWKNNGTFGGPPSYRARLRKSKKHKN